MPSRRGQRGPALTMSPTPARHRPPTTAATHRRAETRAPPSPRRRPPRCSSCATGCRRVTDTPPALAEACAALAAGTGPVAIDAERASGYRYSSRAYLIQLRREGAGTALVDPIALRRPRPAAARPSATPSGSCTPPPRTCPACAEVGLRPARALRHRARRRGCSATPGSGWPRWSRRVLGCSMRKEHSAVDWSTPAAAGAVAGVRRPRRRGRSSSCATCSPRELVEAGKDEWARQEFDAPASASPSAGPRRSRGGVRPGMHRVRGPPRPRPPSASCGRPATRSPSSATSRPGRIIPDSRDRRGRERDADRHARALLGTAGSTAAAPSATPTAGSRRCERARTMPEDELPAARPAYDGPPHAPRAGPSATRSPRRG